MADSAESDATVRLEREFAAPIERVFRAWHDERDLEQWAWGSIGREVKATVDFRVGGHIRVAAVTPKGEQWDFFGEFLEIAEPVRIVYSLQWSAPMGYDTAGERVTVEFAEVPDGCTMVMSHDGVPDDVSRAEHARGWADTFDHLRRVVELR